MRKLLLVLCLFSICEPLLAVSSARDTVMRRGFSSEGLYSFDGLDSVDQMSGNLTVSIPLGPEYVSNGSLRYQFKLAYNSNLWDFVPRVAGPNSYMDGILTIAEVREFLFFDNGREIWDNDPQGNEAVPPSEMNAGLGWMVSLGEVVGGFPSPETPANMLISYIDPAGAKHTFFSKLHGTGLGVSEILSGNGPFFTRDGTYLRMRRLDTAQDNQHKIVIEFPDGTKKYFSACKPNCSGAVGTRREWHLDAITDPFGNRLAVTRSPENRPVTVGADWTWTFTEYTAEQSTPVRTHIAEYRLSHDFGSSTIGYPVSYQLTLKRLRLAAPQSLPNGTGDSEYTFEYKHDAAIHRPSQSNWPYINSMIVPFHQQECVGGGTNCCRPDASSPSCDRLNGSFQASVLTRVNLPANGGTWQFRYYEAGVAGSEPDLKYIGYYLRSDRSGRLQRVIYPTGSGVQYDYEKRSYVRKACPTTRDLFREMYEQTVGVSRRQPGQENGSNWVAIGNPWIYAGQTYQMDGETYVCRTTPDGGSQLALTPNEFVSTTIDPLGKATISYFSLYVHQTPDPGKKWTLLEYGLPISHDDADPAGEGRYISTEVYDCFAEELHTLSGTDLYNAVRRIVPRNRRNADGATFSKCTGPLRSTYVRFENSGTDCDPTQVGNCVHVNRRLASSRTVYRDYCTIDGKDADDPRCIVAAVADQRFIQQDYSEFDGLGHYRTAVTSGNLYAQAFPNAPGGPAQYDAGEAHVNFNPDYEYDAGAQAVTVRPNSQALPIDDAANPWSWQTFNLTRKTHRGRSEYRRFAFDARGFMTAMRSLADNLPPGESIPAAGKLQATDVLLLRNRGLVSDPQVGDKAVSVMETWYGGDVRGGLSPLETAVFNGTSEGDYRIVTRSWLGGTLHSEYQGCFGNLSALTIEDATVDPVMGLTTKVRDAWGLANNLSTGYGYDALGRLTSVTPPTFSAEENYGGEIPIEIAFGNLSASNPDRTVKVKRPQASGLVEERYEFDALGRLKTTRSTVEGVFNRTEIGYGDHGLPSVKSNTGANDNSSLPSAALQYDVFGRVLQLVPPAHTGRKVWTSYFGAQRVVQRVHGVATGVNSTDSVSTTSSYDAFGRLIKLSEDNGVTRYGYDMADRLVEVDQASNQKPRQFIYDGRGFLAREVHPELSTFEVWHQQLDARGNAHRRVYREGGAGDALNEYDLRFDYDSAERVRFAFYREIDSAGSVCPAGSGSWCWRPLKVFTYNENKIASATRHNYVVNPLATAAPAEYAVTNTYSYFRDGALKNVTMATNGLTADIGYSYDNLGNVSQKRYPQAGQFPARAVNYVYDGGSLDALCYRTSGTGCGAGSQSLVSDFEYHPNGLRKVFFRSNGTRDTQGIEDAYARPSSLTACGGSGVSADCSGSPTLWTSGPIVYDGFNNVRRTGPDWFAYDTSGRLKEAKFGASFSQTFDYDQFGNLIKMSATPYAPGVYFKLSNGGTDKVTNRIREIQPSAGAAGPVPTYDLGGNLKLWKDPRFPKYEMALSYDALNYPTQSSLTLVEGATRRQDMGRLFIYDASDERIGTVDYAFPSSSQLRLRETWTLRGADGALMRELTREQNAAGVSTWNWNRDYVYGNEGLVAELSPGAGGSVTTRHTHLDHLGSVRAITNQNGTLVESRKYLPFGQRIMESESVSRMHFAGHERDDDGTDKPYADLDVMHARRYAPLLGRFTAIDPAGGSINDPQSWNRYSYVRNSPMTMIDPTGTLAATPGGDPDGDGNPGCDMCADGSGNQPTPSEEAEAGGYARFGDEITVTAAKDPHAPDVNHDGHGGFSRRSALTQLGADYADLWIADKDIYANYLAGLGTGSGGTLIAGHLMNLVGYHDPDLARKTALVETEGRPFAVGAIAGFAASLWASNNFSGWFRAPRPPAALPVPPSAASPAGPTVGRVLTEAEKTSIEVARQLKQMKAERLARTGGN